MTNASVTALSLHNIERLTNLAQSQAENALTGTANNDNWDDDEDGTYSSVLDEYLHQLDRKRPSYQPYSPVRPQRSSSTHSDNMTEWISQSLSSPKSAPPAHRISHVWESLQMPRVQRMQMTRKYCSTPYAPIFPTVSQRRSYCTADIFRTTTVHFSFDHVLTF